LKFHLIRHGLADSLEILLILLRPLLTLCEENKLVAQRLKELGLQFDVIFGCKSSYARLMETQFHSANRSGYLKLFETIDELKPVGTLGIYH
jgi:phosphohistidine phosphatase SixA